MPGWNAPASPMRWNTPVRFFRDWGGPRNPPWRILIRLFCFPRPFRAAAREGEHFSSGNGKGETMKLRWVAAAAALLLAGHGSAGDALKLTDQKDKGSYSLGIDIGNNLKRQSIDIAPDLLAKGVQDAMSGGETLLSAEEMRETLIALQQQLSAKAQEQRKQVAEKNKKEGEAFLAGNRKKEGVVTLPSGLQYKVAKAGEGASPRETDTVETNYRGTLIDGTEFDSSYKRGQAGVLPVHGGH